MAQPRKSAFEVQVSPFPQGRKRSLAGLLLSWQGNALQKTDRGALCDLLSRHGPRPLISHMDLIQREHPAEALGLGPVWLGTEHPPDRSNSILCQDTETWLCPAVVAGRSPMTRQGQNEKGGDKRSHGAGYRATPPSCHCTTDSSPGQGDVPSAPAAP